MSDTRSLSDLRIAILGLGLMGGSLALALRGKCLEVLGVDIDNVTLAHAHRIHLADRLSQNPQDLLPEADVVILATPVSSILSIIRQLPEWHPGAPVIMDLGSTKADICRTMADLPERFDPIGGHPMCGKECLGVLNADKTIYQGAVFAITPLERSTSRAKNVIESIAQAVGARPFWLDADTHDSWVAATSHLPFLISAIMACGTPGEVKPLVGPGFRSATRLAATPSTMMLDVIKTNRGNILANLSRFRGHLNKFMDLLESESYDDLEDLLINSERKQKNLSAVGDQA